MNVEGGHLTQEGIERFLAKSFNAPYALQIRFQSSPLNARRKRAAGSLLIVSSCFSKPAAEKLLARAQPQGLQTV